MYAPAPTSRLDGRSRAASAIGALAIAALLVWLLMTLGVLPPLRDEPRDEPNSFSLSPDAERVAGEQRAERTPEPSGAAAEREVERVPKPVPKPVTAPPVRVREPPPPPVPAPVPAPAPAPFPGIVLTRDQYAASDIAGKRAAGAGEGESGPGRSGQGRAAGDSVAAYGPGAGPGGQRLFDAEWQREPSDAELAGYLPPGGAPPGSYALIACRTAERFEVENCRSLGEEPRGSGLASAMRQAAWQFRVRPPRIGGKPQIGAWVRIRITFSRAG